MDLLGAPGARDEKLDAEHIPPPIQGQDLAHPRPDPLEVFGRLDDPDEQDAARGHGAVREALDQRADVGDLVGDADAAGEEDDGAVGGEGVEAAVGAFGEGAHDQAAFVRGFGFSVEAVGEAGAAADDGREGGFRGRGQGGVDVLSGHDEAFFGGEVGGCAGPGEGEGVGGPEADGGDGEEGVLAGVEGPRPGDVEG